MLISILGFGSLWSRRQAHGECDADAAYYNTTGVLVKGKLRNRPRIYGVARFNAHGGFRADWTERMLAKVFDCEPPCIWNAHNKVLFKRLLAAPQRPDAYLVTVTAEQTGGINVDCANPWRHAEAHLISFSEYGAQQEVMLVMPAYTWLRGKLGTFFLEPSRQKPWIARLAPSA